MLCPPGQSNAVLPRLEDLFVFRSLSAAEMLRWQPQRFAQGPGLGMIKSIARGAMLIRICPFTLGCLKMRGIP